MKIRSILSITPIIALAISQFGSSSAIAQTTTWTNGGAWNVAGSWDNGVPTSTTDAVMVKTSNLDQSVIVSTGTAYQSLDVSVNTAALHFLTINLSDGTIGGATTLSASDRGRTSLRLDHGRSATLNGAVSLNSSSNVSDAVVLSLGAGSTITATGGISFGGNANDVAGVGSLNSYLTHGNPIANGTPPNEVLYPNGITINADLTFNNGSRYWVSNNGGAGSTVHINGSVTLQAGSFTGGAAEFSVGRTHASDLGAMVKIRDHLSAADSTSVTVRKGKTLEAASATFTSGARLMLNAWAGAEGDATFRTRGDLTIQGGSLITNAAGDNGGYIIDVGGDFKLGAGSTMTISSNATNGITTMHLGGDLEISATSLLSSTHLRELRLVLDGTEPQSLEAAVLGSNQTFAVHTLTFSEGTDMVLIVDNYVNIGEGEAFKTFALVNEGTTTLNLNGLDFYVGNTLLTEGTYTNFGGTLVVIPEPSTYLLLGSALLGVMAYRRRK